MHPILSVSSGVVSLILIVGVTSCNKTYGEKREKGLEEETKRNGKRTETGEMNDVYSYRAKRDKTNEKDKKK